MSFHSLKSIYPSVTVGLTALILSLPGPASAQATPACAMLQKQLRWHEPFFGLQTWSETATEALSHTPSACRAAIAAGQAPEIAAALTELRQHAAPEDASLRRFVYRLTCRLRVPEARRQILDGVHEPAVYADCADALFAMQWPDHGREVTRLREQYLSGLRSEPLKTHVPASVLKAPYVHELAPVLRAYDQARWAGRDRIYRAMCIEVTPTSAESRAACQGPVEREPKWVEETLREGNLDAGISHLATLPPDKLPQLGGLLRSFDAQRKDGRDRLYGMLCSRHVPQDPQLRATCSELRPEEEGRWVALSKRARVTAEIDRYLLGGRMFAVSLLILAAVFLLHRLRHGEKRALQPN